MHGRVVVFAKSTPAGVALVLVAITAGAQGNRVDRAAWLAGCWELRTPSRVVLEMWMPPTGDLMLGGSRTVVAGGVTREFEHLRLRARGDTLIYTAIPSGQRETDFRSTSVTPDAITFENPAHDFPKKIIYRRAGRDSIVARIEGPGPNNATRGIDFPYRRVDCTAPSAAPASAPPAPPDTVVIDAELSPDGRRVALVKGLGQNWDLYIANADGSDMRRITDHGAVDYQPAWSPDGTRLAFTSARDGHQEIYLVQPDGSGLSQLTRGSAHNSDPSWSRDGRQLLFRSERDGSGQIYVMNADGSGQRALTAPPDVYAGASWAPDGQRILLSSARERRNELYTIRSDGTDERRLTTSASGHSAAGHWSPDGRSIAFWTTRDGNDEVYVMNADGSNPRNVTNHASRDFVLGWSPDGAYILFRSNRDRPGNEIYRMKPDGSEVTRLTNTASVQ